TGNIGVYDSAPPTTTANYNLVWQTGAGAEYVWAGTKYSTQSSLHTATGQEENGIFASPLFANPAAWNLQLTQGSPAIGSADPGASGAQPADVLGNPRTQPDMGAYEYQQPQTQGPAAHLTVSPGTGTAPLAVTADASASTQGS